MIFGALGLITDVRLCNEIYNAVICQEGAVMSFFKEENTCTTRADIKQKTENKQKDKPKVNSKQSAFIA